MMVWVKCGRDLDVMGGQHRGTSTGVVCVATSAVMTVRSRVPSRSIRSGKFRTIMEKVSSEGVDLLISNRVMSWSIKLHRTSLIIEGLQFGMR